MKFLYTVSLISIATVGCAKTLDAATVKKSAPHTTSQTSSEEKKKTSQEETMRTWCIVQNMKFTYSTDRLLYLQIVHPSKIGMEKYNGEPSVTALYVDDSNLQTCLRRYKMSPLKRDPKKNIWNLSELVLDDTRSPQSDNNNQTLRLLLGGFIAAYKKLCPKLKIASDPLISITSPRAQPSSASKTPKTPPTTELPGTHEFWVFQSKCAGSKRSYLKPTCIPASQLPLRPDAYTYIILGISPLALSQKIAQSVAEKRKFFMPGNPGEFSPLRGIKRMVNDPDRGKDFAEACKAAEKSNGHILLEVRNNY